MQASPAAVVGSVTVVDIRYQEPAAALITDGHLHQRRLRACQSSRRGHASCLHLLQYLIEDVGIVDPLVVVSTLTQVVLDCEQPRVDGAAQYALYGGRMPYPAPFGCRYLLAHKPVRDSTQALSAQVQVRDLADDLGLRAVQLDARTLLRFVHFQIPSHRVPIRKAASQCDSRSRAAS